MSVAILGLVAVAAAVAQEFQPIEPSAEHEQMAREAGMWDAEIKMWHTADSEPMVSKGTETNKMFGQYWLLSEFKSNFGGQPYEGRGQFGYDPVAKKCVGSWIDTMTPYAQKMEGNYDAKTHTLTMNTEYRDPMTGKMAKGKNVTKYVDNNTKTFEIYGPSPEGVQYKMLEITYKRRS
jgi:hypothetical protein